MLHEKQQRTSFPVKDIAGFCTMNSCAGAIEHLEGRVDFLPVVCRPRAPLLPLALPLTWSVTGAAAFELLAFGLSVRCKLVLSDKAEDECMPGCLLLPGCISSDSQAVWYLDLHMSTGALDRCEGVLSAWDQDTCSKTREL